MILRKLAAFSIALFAGLFIILGGLTTAEADVQAPQLVAPTEGVPATLVHDRNGNWFWRASIADYSDYVASWERSSGVFDSPTEARLAIAALSDCRSTVVHDFLYRYPTKEELYTHFLVNDDGSWTSPELEDEIGSECDNATEWSDAQTPGFRDSNGNWTVEIPLSVIGPGAHKVFLMGVDYSGSSQDAACSRQWEDGTWTGYDCLASTSEPVYFNVIVPQPPAGNRVLVGPNVAKSTFFDQTIFSDLPTFTIPEPLVVASTAGVSVVLAALVGFPTGLLSSAISKMHARASARKRWKWLDWTARGWQSLPFFLAASVIAGFSDPSFGWNWMSLRVTLTGFAVFAITDAGATWIAWRFTRAHSGQEKPQMVAKPFFLLIVAGTVLFARVTEIDPAMVFGSVVAIQLGTQISKATKGVVAIATTIYSFALGFISWGIYSWLVNVDPANVAAGSSSPEALLANQAWLGFAQVMLGEFAAIMVCSAFATIPLALLPFPGLGGEALFAWNKWAWGILYVIGLTAFSIVILPLPSSWQETTEPLAAWTGLFIAYAVFALAAYGFITYKNAKDARDETILNSLQHSDRDRQNA